MVVRVNKDKLSYKMKSDFEKGLINSERIIIKQEVNIVKNIFYL